MARERCPRCGVLLSDSNPYHHPTCPHKLALDRINALAAKVGL